MSFGDRLKQLREAASLTQQSLAEKVGVTYQRISDWERGPSVPSWRYVCALADALGVSTEAFREKS